MQIPEDFRCCICLGASSQMLLGQCPHRLCLSCARAGKLRSCPVCSSPLPKGLPQDVYFARAAKEMLLPCRCGAKVRMLEAENHTCEWTGRQQQHEGVLNGKTGGRTPPPTAPNRETFTCPLCKEANLSREGLLNHCSKAHRNTRVAAVCPICLSMPWGDPNYVSQDFLSHVQLRHRCAYDTLTDFEADEETMLRRAIEASLEEAESARLQKPEAAEGKAREEAMLRHPLQRPALLRCCRRRR